MIPDFTWNVGTVRRCPLPGYGDDGGAAWMMAPDGKRFAVLYPDGSAEQPITGVAVLLNFVDELKRRVPVGGK